MSLALFGLAGLCSLGCLVCWIIVLTKIFPESVGKGIFAIICALYAFIWGWQNKSDGLDKVMPIWTVCLVASIGLRVAGAMAASQQ